VRAKDETAVTRPRISFVVPVRNDVARLRRCLEAIRGCGLDAAAYEVIVVDNGSSDGSPDAARLAGARVVVLGDFKVSALRNRGAALAAADVVAFCDADNLIAADWARVALQLFEDPRVGAVGASYDSPTPSNWVQQAFDGLRDHGRGTRPTRWLAAGNMAVRRTALESVRGFDETLEACEDVDLSTRLRMADWTVLSDCRLASVHLGDPTTLTAVFRGELWRGRDNVRVSLRGPLGWRDLPSIVIPFADLGGIGLLAAGLMVTAVPALRPLGLAAMAGGLATLAGFAALRTRAILDRSLYLGWAQAHRAFAVACTYDVARALALVWHVGHHRNRGK
jgi:hypothetical protein